MTHSWAAARALAAQTRCLPTVEVPLAEALGLTLAADVRALSDLPAFDTSAMDGWAVAGPPPWALVGPPAGVLAGQVGASLSPGQAVPIATGAALPSGAEAVLRSEVGRVDGLTVDGPPLAAGTDLRRAASECRRGEVVATAGMRVRPATIGLVAAAGADTLQVIRRPTVEVLVLGDELLDHGPATASRVRDALGPLLPGWLTGLGATVTAVTHLPDDAGALSSALSSSSADLVVTTGSTASGPVDHLHAVLRGLGSALVVDGVAVRPGHPMLLARLADGRPLVGLPGNPLAAVSALVTLVEPTVRALRGGPAAAARSVVLAERVVGHPTDVRLVPVLGGVPVHHVGPAMLRGLAEADALAVIDPGGAAAGQTVLALALP